MKKKAGMFNTLLLVILVISVVFGVGHLTNWFGLTEEPEPVAGTVVPSKVGEQGSLKYSVRTVTDNSPVQFAGTGYCWDTTTPKLLLESSTGKTLSSTAGTTFAPVSVGSSYECTAFSANHMCEHKSGKMSGETMNLRSDCKNLTTPTELEVIFFEDGAKETTNSLTIGSGGSNSFGKVTIQLNITDKYFPLKAICFGTNDTVSQLKKITQKGATSDDVPDYMSSTSDDWCWVLDTAMEFYEWDEKELGSILVEAKTGEDPTGETINMTFHDECEYVARDGSIKTDWFARDTDDKNDCGAPDHEESFTIV